MKKIMLLCFVSFLLVLPLTQAWGPHSHNLIVDRVCAEYENNEILEMCCENPVTSKL